MSAESILEARALTVAIGGKTVCRELSLTFGAGQCWAVLGLNGAGKTTLLHTLAGVRAAQAGEVLLDGVSLALQPRRTVAKKLGLLVQDPADAFDCSVLEAALIGRHPHLPRWWQQEGEADQRIAEAALAAADLAGLASRHVSSLSGGERERLAIAAILAQQPRVFLLDEPTSHLDSHHQLSMLKLFAQKCAEASIVLMSLHDASLAARFCTHALLMHDGGEIEAGPVEEILGAAALSRLYRHNMREFNNDGLRLFIPE